MKKHSRWRYSVAIAAVLTVQMAWSAVAAAADLNARKKFSIASQPLAAALLSFSRQANIQVMTASSDLSNLVSTAVSGEKSVQEALNSLLQNTGLKFYVVSDDAVSIEPAREKTARKDQIALLSEQLKRAVDSPSEADTAAAEADSASSKGIPEILVPGKRSANTDIVRTEDDVQPYVVFDAQDIERSLSQNLEDFLSRQLPMNIRQGSNSQNGEAAGNISNVDLRGLGPDETLLLVNGRRLPGVAITQMGELGQPDINGIPLSAVERIEVLPSTASGIYGGGATGGVVNIILKSDYNRLEVSTAYDNSFDTDSGTRRIDLTGGFSFGKTSFMVGGSYSDGNEMLTEDRDFVRRGNRLFYSNVPEDHDAFVIPLSSTTNIRGLEDPNNGGYYELALANPNGGAPISLGDSKTHIPLGYAGIGSDGGAALIANAGRFSFDQPRDVQGLKGGLVNTPVVSSLLANMRHRFTSTVEAFLDLSWSLNEGHIQEASDSNEFYLCPAPGSEPNFDYCVDSLDEPIFSLGNPFTVPVQVTFPVPGLGVDRIVSADTRIGNGGFIVRLPHQWIAQAEYGWSRSRTESAETDAIVSRAGLIAIDSGELDIFRDLNISPPDFDALGFGQTGRVTGPLDMTRTGATLRLAGPLYELPGGPLTLSAFGERRKTDSALGRVLSPAGTSYFLPRSETVNSLSLETYVPLISSRNPRFWASALEMQASVRYDRYLTNAPEAGSVLLREGRYVVQKPRLLPSDPLSYREVNHFTRDVDSIDFTVGLRYAPTEDLALRASFGTGFKPPGFLQTAQTEAPVRITNLIDPRRQRPPPAAQNRREPPFVYTRITGGGPELRPEESESISVGAVLTPRILPGLRVSVDFTDIKKDGEIQGLQTLYPTLQLVLANEANLPGIVTRGPLSASDIANGFTGGPIQMVDLGLINASKTSVRSFDLQVEYLFDTAIGEFRAYALGTHLKDFLTRLQATSPEVSTVGLGSRLEWRGNAGLSFQARTWSMDWNMQYYDRYRLSTVTVVEQGTSMIPRQVYHDLTAKVRLGEALGASRGILADTELLVGVRNIFDTSPPIIATPYPALGYSTFGDPRLRRYSIGLRKSFQ